MESTTQQETEDLLSDLSEDVSEVEQSYELPDDEQTSHSVSVSFAINERSVLLSQTEHGTYGAANDAPDKHIESNFVNVSVVKKRKGFRESVFHAGQKITKFSHDNYLGFSGFGRSVLYDRELEMSKTLSLADVPSFDRRTPSPVYFCTMLGIITSLSVYAIPNIVANAGLYFIPFFFAIASLSCYCAVLIKRCQYQESSKGGKKRVYTSIFDLGSKTIKFHGGVFMDIVSGTNVLSDVYTLIFCAQVTVDLFQKYVQIDIRLWMVIWVLIAFPFFFIKRMSILTWFGLISLILSTIAFIIVLVGLAVRYKEWKLSNVLPTMNFKSLKSFFIGYGVVLNSYNFHIGIPSLEASMQEPEMYTKLTVASFAVNTLIKILVSVIGAATFGLATAGSLITNFQDSTSGIIANTFIGLAMFFLYPTYVFVSLEAIEGSMYTIFKPCHSYKNCKGIWSIVCRFFVCAVILILATAVPRFEVVTSLVGNVRGTITSITLPLYFYICLFKKKISRWNYVLHVIILIITFALGVIGAAFNIHSMVTGT